MEWTAIEPVLQRTLHTCDMEASTSKTIIAAIAAHFGVTPEVLQPFKARIKEDIDVFVTNAQSSAEAAAHTLSAAAAATAAAADEGDEEDHEDDGEAQGGFVPDESAMTEWERLNIGKFGYMCVGMLAPALATFLGEQYMARNEVVSRIWAYIKRMDLPKANKGVIILDQPLATALNRKTVSFKSMSRAVNANFSQFYRADPSGAKSPSAGKVRTPAKAGAHAVDDADSASNGPKHVLSAELVDVVGEPQLSRPQVVKHIWRYIRDNNLQKTSDRRIIVCDAKLKRVMGQNEVTMFTMNKLLSSHIGERVEEDGAASRSKSKKRKAAADDDGNAAAPKQSRNHPVYVLSAELVDVVGAPALSRTEVVKQIWAYIRANNLQKETDKRTIVCDAKLKRVMGQAEVTMFTMNKLLSPHIGARVPAKKARSSPSQGAAAAPEGAEDEVDDDEDGGDEAAHDDSMDVGTEGAADPEAEAGAGGDHEPVVSESETADTLHPAAAAAAAAASPVDLAH